MKISRLKRQADAAETEARSNWLEFRAHSDRSVAIVRGRVGSPAGLAISFSLGFMAGTGGRGGKSNDVHAADSKRPAHQEDRGLAYKLAHGPVGDAAIRLGTALAARSLLNFLNDGREDESVNYDEGVQA